MVALKDPYTVKPLKPEGKRDVPGPGRPSAARRRASLLFLFMFCFCLFFSMLFSILCCCFLLGVSVYWGLGFRAWGFGLGAKG